MRHTEPVTVYQLGEWYVRRDGTEFLLCEYPSRVLNKPGSWVGPALFRNGMVQVLEWGPNTRRRASWIVRAFRVVLAWFQPAKKNAELFTQAQLAHLAVTIAPLVPMDLPELKAASTSAAVDEATAERVAS